ncbi:general secretion pathway protein GspE [Vibrio galatheae]|uniref:General secretion pathway protein GspE n=1 Tax=Vibrio galatheae TaxID=579748 RepID=A0A0F4NL84_9VIBR|nr:type IV-A pilus assembly ATPase PilB [Vibrio galatheae]KJY83618.1 general secretion pathway protein GspE [Vibrio galatheae]
MTNLPTILRQAKLLDSKQEAQLLESSKAANLSVVEALLKLDWFSPAELLSHLSRIFALPVIDFSNYDYQSVCRSLGLVDLIRQYEAIPIRQSDHQLLIAIADPSDLNIEEEFRFATGKQIELVLADSKQIKGVIRQMYGTALDSETWTHNKELSGQDLANLVHISDDELDDLEDLSADNAPVSRYINQILLDAIRKRASDIHFEPYESSYRVRFRCDGLLIETQQPSHTLSRRLSARLKIIAKLDIAQRRLPQDGRIKLQLTPDTAIDMRISTLPTLWGEKIVLRLLDSNNTELNIQALGYNDLQQAIYQKALAQPQGMILMTGPTGSGKTVSLYAGLNFLNTPQVNIASAEDPVEINLPGINQVQINPQIGLDFAQALRAFLRQDPDIVMVGEIRDLETAEIAVKAAQTGHLVLSTLHTNSAAESILRLQHLGISPADISSSLSLVIAQRLARKLCEQCKVEEPISAELEQQLGITELQSIYRANPTGCPDCNQGYFGRIGLYEVMSLDPTLVQVINHSNDVRDIEQVAIKQGMQTLRDSGIEKLLDGLTSYQELQRVLYL